MPHPLSERIEQLAQRLSRQRWVNALSWVLAVTLAVATALMLADYVYRSRDGGLRWLAALVLDGAVAYAIYRLIGPLWRRPVTEDSVALAVERRFPQLGSRLASALEFLRQRTDDPQAGSQELRRAVVVAAASDIENLPIETIVDPLPQRRALTAAALAVAGLVVFALADARGLKIAAGRLAAPWSDLDWPRHNRLAVTEAPTRIARGQAFEATVVDLNGALPDDLQVIYRTVAKGKERLDAQPLPVAGEAGVVRRENVQQPFAFRAVGGDDQTMAWTEVDVVDPPSVDKLAIKARPPSYTGLPRRTVGPDVRVLAGTQLEVTARSPQPLVSAAVEVTTGEDVRRIPAEFAMLDGVTQIVLPAKRWTVDIAGDEATTDRFCLRVEDDQGLVGRTPSRRLTVEPDPAPEVKWDQPTSDQFVLAQAVIPVASTVSDNLAVQWVELVAQRTLGDSSSSEPIRNRIYDNGAEPPNRNDNTRETRGDSVRAETAWSLADLELAEGDQLALTIEAADYRPGVGSTAVARRVTIISSAELDTRIAEAAAALARTLERTLADQRAVRQGSRDVEVARRAGEAIDDATTDRLTTLGYEQRQVAEALSDPARGAAETARALLAEIENNRLQRPELAERLGQVTEEAARLAGGPLPDAERSLADARRDSERGAESNEAMGASLAAADKEQTAVVESLETLVDGLGQWTDRQRFVREAAELQRSQQDLVSETRRAAAEAAAAPEGAATEAAQEKIAAAQAELSRRFDRLQRGLREQVERIKSDASSSSTLDTAPMEDALAETDERATGGKLADAARQVSRGQLGRAAAQQSSAAEDLQRMLDTLRNQAPSDPKELAEALREAGQELAELRDQAGDEAAPAGDNRQAERREKLAGQAQRLGRKLERLTAEASAQSTGDGGQQMSQAADQTESAPQEATQQMQQADQRLADAERQLRQRQRELENQITQTVLQKLAGKIDGYVAQQRRVLDGAVLAADAAEQARREATARLAGDERSLERIIAAAADELSSRAVFALALGGAAEDMQHTAERLAAADASRPTQRMARSALQRLQHIARVLKPDPNLPPPESQQQPPGEGAGGGSGKQPPPPPVDVAELKMLRLMQLDLNARTRAWEADSAAALLSQSESRAAATRLAAEQDELADLVRELAARDNTSDGEPPLETN